MNTYSRVLSTKEVNALTKEAQRVKYIVNKVRVFNPKLIDAITVLDDDNNDLVFKALRWDRHTWCVTFSKTYWQSPDAAFEGVR
jgi:hypothetical protein